MKNIIILAILNLQCWTRNLEQIKQNKTKSDRKTILFLRNFWQLSFKDLYQEGRLGIRLYLISILRLPNFLIS